MNVERLHKECEMDDAFGHALNELDAEGYRGNYADERTGKLESTLHRTYHAVLKGTATLTDFKAFLGMWKNYLKAKSAKG